MFPLYSSNHCYGYLTVNLHIVPQLTLYRKRIAGHESMHHTVHYPLRNENLSYYIFRR
nr:MAG TPA: hypothetical protein [Caudoviricetes sp.]